MTQAVILAGGKGTRLKDRLHGLPKPLIDVDGTPLLGRQLDQLQAQGFDDVLILVNHAVEHIERFCTDRVGGPRVRLIDDGEPKGTAGALLAAWDSLDDRFLVVYGDTLFDVDLRRLWHWHATVGGEASLFLHPNDHPQDSDLVVVDEPGRILAFHPYPHAPGKWLPNLVNAALYVIDKRALDRWRDLPVPADLAKDLFPRMLREGVVLTGYRSFEYIKDIGTPARLDKAIGHLRSGVVAHARWDSPQKAVFLDRDGTLNRSNGFISRADRFDLIGGVAGAIRRLNDAEYRVVVVTNQPVVARGEATLEDLRLIHAKLDTELGRQGAFVDRLYLCPHHPDGGFAGEVAALKIACTCRKPGIGLIEQAVRDLNIDLGRSWLVGDTTTDMLTARRAGLRSILVQTGEAGRDGKFDGEPGTVAADLVEAVAHILDQDNLPARQEPAPTSLPDARPRRDWNDFA